MKKSIVVPHTLLGAVLGGISQYSQGSEVPAVLPSMIEGSIRSFLAHQFAAEILDQDDATCGILRNLFEVITKSTIENELSQKPPTERYF